MSHISSKKIRSSVQVSYFHLRCYYHSLCPFPVLHLWKVFAVLHDIFLVPLQSFVIPIACLTDHGRESRNPANRIERQLEAIEIVEHRHVEGGGSGSLFLIAGAVDVV